MLYWFTWIRAVGLFYRSIAPFTLGITALLMGFALLPLLQERQAAGLLPKLLLAKALTAPAVWYLAEQMRPDQYWFYYNLGISRRQLWAGVAMLDGLFFIGIAQAIIALCS